MSDTLENNANIYKTIKSVVIITFNTEERYSSHTPPSLLHTNNFQIIIASVDDVGASFMMIHYDQLDSLFGASGFSVPHCYAGLLRSVLHAQSLTLAGDSAVQTYGSLGVFLSTRCKVSNTGTLFFIQIMYHRLL